VVRCFQRRHNPWNQSHGAGPWPVVTFFGDFRDEDQGDYGLAIAVSPRNIGVLMLGMVEIYLTRNADNSNPGTATWSRAQWWQFFGFDRAHHADHHQLVFDRTTNPPGLWTANDGGVSVTFDAADTARAAFPSPSFIRRQDLPAAPLRWRR